MILFKKSADLQSHLQKLSITQRVTGFVPTMGALHEGHISLIKKSKEIADTTICSIFINPTQFNNAEDLKKYPKNTEQDIYLLESNGCDILFLPDINEVYPGSSFNESPFALGNLENILEGKYRPGHFQGVCQVVNRLLQIVNPVYLLAGQKDYQQCLVLKKLLVLTGSATELIICPTTRDDDGLAMSSRNQRLNDIERVQATAIFQALSFLLQHITRKRLVFLKEITENFLTAKGFKVDYIEIANAGTLWPVEEWNGRDRLVILAAVHLNNIRLIDNLEFNPEVY